MVALDFDGLNARTLVHLNDFPTSVDLVGSDGSGVFDSDLSFVSGRVVLVFDTVNGSVAAPVDVEVFDVREDWHVPTVTWEAAVDTAGDRRLWTQPGGGPTTLLGGATFDAFVDRLDDDTAALVDTLSIAIDSAAVAAIGDGVTGLLVAAAAAGGFRKRSYG